MRNLLPVLALLGLVGCSGGSSPQPTNPTPSPAPVAGFTVSGLIAELTSAQGELTGIPDFRIEVTSGPNTGSSSMSDSTGHYSIASISPGSVSLRVTKAGFQTAEASIVGTSGGSVTSNLTVRRTCEPFPAAIQAIMAKLATPDGLCLVRQPGPNASSYDASTRTIYFRKGSPVGGELAAIAHEVQHAHQHRMILDAGLGEPGNDSTFVPKWTQTSEGRRFVELTGWHLSGDPNQAPTFGWIEHCEQWSCGYTNPIEDAAEYGANWYNPAGVYPHSQGELEANSPNRAVWASQYLPK